MYEIEIERYINKTQIKEDFCLTDKMLEDIGEPDFIVTSINNKLVSPISLFLVKRIRPWIKNHYRKNYEYFLTKKLPLKKKMRRIARFILRMNSFPELISKITPQLSNEELIVILNPIFDIVPFKDIYLEYIQQYFLQYPEKHRKYHNFTTTLLNELIKQNNHEMHRKLANLKRFHKKKQTYLENKNNLIKKHNALALQIKHQLEEARE